MHRDLLILLSREASYIAKAIYSAGKPLIRDASKPLDIPYYPKRLLQVAQYQREMIDKLAWTYETIGVINR